MHGPDRKKFLKKSWKRRNEGPHKR